MFVDTRDKGAIVDWRGAVIERYAGELATRMGLPLSNISIAGEDIHGGSGTCLLELDSGRKQTSVLVYQSELDAAQQGSPPELLIARLMVALLRLQFLYEQPECGA